MARTAPSGTRGDACGDEPRTRGALAPAECQELVWAKPTWSRFFYELRAGETVVATLAWTGGSRAVAECVGAQYRFSREGWLRQRILVRGGASGGASGAGAPEETVATFARRHGGGTLTFPEGRTFLWRKPRGWASERGLAGGKEKGLVPLNPLTPPTG